MKLLMLYGVNCTKEIWKYIKPYLDEYEVEYVEYPHEITLHATKVEHITKWVYENYSSNYYDAIIGHSLGGIIALQLISEYKMKCGKIIYLDTNLKPAEMFYRNLMTQEHMNTYGDEIIEMFNAERKFYRIELFEAIQEDFDYTNYLENISQPVYALYGNRGQSEYENRIRDLNLSDDTLDRLEIRFISDACHMIMVENPLQLVCEIKNILQETIVYKELMVEDIEYSMFAFFDRTQVVTKCWRKIDGEWLIKDVPFIDNWSQEEYQEGVQYLKRVIELKGYVVGAFYNGQLKGFASVEYAIFGASAKYMNLSNIHVSKDMRQNGIGKKLFHLAKNWAKEHHAEKLYISAHSAIESQAFYKAMGCVEAVEYNKQLAEKEPCDCQLECSLL